MRVNERVNEGVNEMVNKRVNKIFELKYKVTTMRTYILVYGVK